MFRGKRKPGAYLKKLPKEGVESYGTIRRGQLRENDHFLRFGRKTEKCGPAERLEKRNQIRTQDD